MQRHVVIGDIHGCFVELQQLLELVGISADDILVSVGDLVDRGPESPEVVRFFRERPNAAVVAGNHERKHVRRILSYAQEITRLQFGSDYEEAVQWMGSLPYILELDNAIIVHAALVPGRSIAEQDPEVLCGSTSGERKLEEVFGNARWHEKYSGCKPVIFGHHVVEEPLIREKLIYGIDTGACHGGRLTALTLPDFRVYTVASREDHWKRMKVAWQADVLAAKPWATMLWQELDEQLERFSHVGEERTSQYVRALYEWRARIEARTDAVLTAIHNEARRFESEAGLAGRAELAKQHPLSKFLFQSFGGRLDRAALIRQVHTARGLNELGAILGFDALEVPAVPNRTG